MKTLIIDGNNLIHRTFWTAKTQSKRSNIDDTAEISNFHIYFTLNAVLSYVTKYNPDKVYFAWDEKTLNTVNPRKLKYTNYKENRSKDSTPHQNNNKIKEFLACLGIQSIFPRSLEADDVIAYICNEEEGKKIIISVDKDFLQLINKNVFIYDPIKKQEYNYDNFYEKTGYESVDIWLKAKCLRGDKSDNVEGILSEAKIKKYFTSELTLTLDQQRQYDLNYELFKLGDFSLYIEEVESYRQQLSTPLTPNWTKFTTMCVDHKLNAILNKKETWYSLFFIKNKLQYLFK